MSYPLESLEPYRKLLLLMIRAKRQFAEVIEERNMTPVQGTLLMLFEPGSGKSMHELSSLMGCDASNITGLVGRLEASKMIDRRTDPSDRRVKQIYLSSRGQECRCELLEGLRKAEAADMNVLTDEEQRCLVKIVDKLVGDK